MTKYYICDTGSRLHMVTNKIDVFQIIFVIYQEEGCYNDGNNTLMLLLTEGRDKNQKEIQNF